MFSILKILVVGPYFSYIILSIRLFALKQSFFAFDIWIGAFLAPVGLKFMSGVIILIFFIALLTDTWGVFFTFYCVYPDGIHALVDEIFLLHIIHNYTLGP